MLRFPIWSASCPTVSPKVVIYVGMPAIRREGSAKTGVRGRSEHTAWRKDGRASGDTCTCSIMLVHTLRRAAPDVRNTFKHFGMFCQPFRHSCKHFTMPGQTFTITQKPSGRSCHISIIQAFRNRVPNVSKAVEQVGIDCQTFPHIFKQFLSVWPHM